MKQYYCASGALALISVIQWHIFLQQIGTKQKMSWECLPTGRWPQPFRLKHIYCEILEKLVVQLRFCCSDNADKVLSSFSVSSAQFRAFNMLILLGPDEWYPGADTIWLLSMKDSLKFSCCEHRSTRTILSDLNTSANSQQPNPHCCAQPSYQSERKQI